MTDHEMIMISAERYALGRRTYIVGIVTQYIANHIDEMSEHCKRVLIDGGLLGDITCCVLNGAEWCEDHCSATCPDMQCIDKWIEVIGEVR